MVVGSGRRVNRQLSGKGVADSALSIAGDAE